MQVQDIQQLVKLDVRVRIRGDGVKYGHRVCTVACCILKEVAQVQNLNRRILGANVLHRFGVGCGEREERTKERVPCLAFFSRVCYTFEPTRLQASSP